MISLHTRFFNFTRAPRIKSLNFYGQHKSTCRKLAIASHRHICRRTEPHSALSPSCKFIQHTMHLIDKMHCVLNKAKNSIYKVFTGCGTIVYGCSDNRDQNAILRNEANINRSYISNLVMKNQAELQIQSWKALGIMES